MMDLGAKLPPMSTSPKQQRGRARTKLPVRDQIEVHFLALDQLLEADHRVRTVWAYAESCDLTELYAQIRAVEGAPGRNAVDPRLLFALWLFATLESVTSARRLELFTQENRPYQWLCGGVSVNYHLLSDFRTDNGELLERLIIDSVAVLHHHGLITLEEVAQDGMRVRAHAGSGSFRREKTLTESLKLAEQHVAALRQQHEDDPTGEDRRHQAAKQRAAAERVQKLQQAQAELQQLNEQRKKQRRGTKGTSEARASTTDPEARKMKMGDGGFRPGYNVNFATDCNARVIVAVDVVKQGSDHGLLPVLHEQIVNNYGTTPGKLLVDGGFTKDEDVTHLARRGTLVYAPVHHSEQHLAAGKNPYEKQPGDTPEVAEFRQRMGTPEAKAIYQKRSSVAEFPNAECRNRGLTQFRVRGLKKVKAQTLWHVLTFNLLRFVDLGWLEVVLNGKRVTT
jgi:transposase